MTWSLVAALKGHVVVEENDRKISMALVNLLHMNSGDGESSYASNSLLQETAIRKASPILKHTIKGMANQDVFNHFFMMADLGCSSGTNTLLVTSNIIDVVQEVCYEYNHKPPQIQVCLNDLFGNDFNTIFKHLPDFYAKLVIEKGENFGPCFVYGVPGSFYARLFPDKSLHLVHSSYSLQWLSQVPEGLERNSLNIYITKTSPPNIIEAYRKQFHNDFMKFLQMRYAELVYGGRMVLTLPCRSLVDPTADDCCSLWDLLEQSLIDMLKEGLVQEADIISFNLPCYVPSEEEVMKLVQYQGSFSIDDMSTFEVNWDPHDPDYISTKDSKELAYVHGKNTTKVIRAIMEPLLISHFGSSLMDVLFYKYGNHVAEHLCKKKARHNNVVISLTKVTKE